MKEKGLIVSIDFELDWGYTNIKNPLSEDEISNGLDRLIALLKKHQIKSTWAIVGQLFQNSNKEDLDNSKRRLKWITKNLINNHLVEVGSHTYNHIFCEEVSVNVFKEDLKMMTSIANSHNKPFRSIVFPRNQYNKTSTDLLNQAKYTHFRSVLSTWFLKNNKYTNESVLKRLCIRFAELIPLNRDVIITDINSLTAISDSRFFRFFPNTFIGRILTKYYIKLLKLEMKRCFKRGHYYHIWFHPHNMMKNPNAIKNLDHFLSYFKQLETSNKNIKSYKFSEINCK